MVATSLPNSPSSRKSRRRRSAEIGSSPKGHRKYSSREFCTLLVPELIAACFHYGLASRNLTAMWHRTWHSIQGESHPAESTKGRHTRTKLNGKHKHKHEHKAPQARSRTPTKTATTKNEAQQVRHANPSQRPTHKGRQDTHATLKPKQKAHNLKRIPRNGAEQNSKSIPAPCGQGSSSWDASSGTSWPQ